MAAIEVRDLSCFYGSVQALDGISFSVAKGEVFALLGPHGAGKTTIVEILEGRRSPTGGMVEVLGCDPAGLSNARSDGIGHRLLILDEPTPGLDGVAPHRAGNGNVSQRGSSTTILLTTRHADEAHRLADRVCVLRSGRLLAVGTPEELRITADLPTVITFRIPGGGLSELPPLSAVPRLIGGVVRLETREPVTDTWRLTGWANAGWFALADLGVAPPTFEEVYLALLDAR